MIPNDPRKKASGQRQLLSALSPSAKLHEETLVALKITVLQFQSQALPEFDYLFRSHKLRKCFLGFGDWTELPA